MAQVIPSRMTAEVDGDFVVFLIGMRINKPWKLHKWLPVFLAMPRMLRELEGRPDSGFLGHWPAWVAFNKRIGTSRGDVGIWHETYQVRAGQYETVYSGMPPFGLGKFGKLVPATGMRDTAKGRFTA